MRLLLSLWFAWSAALLPTSVGSRVEAHAAAIGAPTARDGVPAVHPSMAPSTAVVEYRAPTRLIPHGRHVSRRAAPPAALYALRDPGGLGAIAGARFARGGAAAHAALVRAQAFGAISPHFATAPPLQS